MTKRSEQVWEFYRLTGRAIYLGHVNALAEFSAIKIAIEELRVSNPDHQKRLVASKVG